MFTKHHKIIFEASSAIQKEIRRGNEESALFWAFELVPLYEKYLWKRLIVIANEDIGLAAPDVIVLIVNLRSAWFTLRDMGAQDECRLILANAILALCRAPKARLADHFQCVVFSDWQTSAENRDVPDYALDKHTLRGKQMGRKMDFFLHNEDDPIDNPNIHDPYKPLSRELWLGGMPEKQEKWPLPKSIKDADQTE